MPGVMAAALAGVLVAGCAAGASAPATAGSTAGRQTSSATATGLALATLPDLTLPRLGVAGSERLPAVPAGTPTVINLWASWCTPCQQELPSLQAVADSAGPRLRFLGVLTKDGGDGWRQTVQETAVRYPSVRDDDGELLARLRVPPALPVTVLVRGDGSVTGVYQGPALTQPALRQLVAERLGVAL